jgi:hypothetical protein
MSLKALILSICSAKCWKRRRLFITLFSPYENIPLPPLPSFSTPNTIPTATRATFHLILLRLELKLDRARWGLRRRDLGLWGHYQSHNYVQTTILSKIRLVPSPRVANSQVRIRTADWVCSGAFGVTVENFYDDKMNHNMTNSTLNNAESENTHTLIFDDDGEDDAHAQGPSEWGWEGE